MRELLRGDRAGGLLAVQHRAGHRLLAATRCCRRASSPMPTRIAIGWARTTRRLPVNAPKVPGASLSQGRRDALLPQRHRHSAMPITSRTQLSGPKQDRPLRRAAAGRFTVMPIATIIARAMTITCSRAISSVCSTRIRNNSSYGNIAAAMRGVPESIVRRQLALFTKCDPAYGEGVRRALKLDPIGDDRLKGTSATDQAKGERCSSCLVFPRSSSLVARRREHTCRRH